MLKFLIKYIIIYIHSATKRERKREEEERKKGREGERNISVYTSFSARLSYIYPEDPLYRE